jgi:hypothetical protein
MDLVRIRAHFERFPISLKGALVMRGADGNPHQVRLGATRVVELGGRGTAPMGVAPATLDVAPNRDLFVPFEFPVAELEPGWYAIECEVSIDGSPTTVRPGKRFAVPWPRGSTRRDQVSLGRSVEVGGDEVRLDRLECASDSISVAYEGGEASLSLTADGTRLPVLDSRFDPDTGTGVVTAYPVMKTQHRLAVSIKGAAERVEIHLP